MRSAACSGAAYAQYAGVGRRGNDRCLRQRACDKGYSGTDLHDYRQLWAHGACAGASYGCGQRSERKPPAYVFMFIEAMADAAVAQGMARKQAYSFAAQAVLGAAKLVLETGKHPGELKDMVCSPAGTTIEGVRALERAGMRSAVYEALQACADKGKRL